MIWIMIIMIVALALIGVPMSFSMLTGSVWFMLTSGMPQTLMIQRLIMAVGDSFSMLAIPFFMLAGTIMNAGGVATRIFDGRPHSRRPGPRQRLLQRDFRRHVRQRAGRYRRNWRDRAEGHEGSGL